jgi:hypothetical protein
MALITGGTIVDGEIEGLTATSETTGGYFEQRTDPDDEDKTQVRAHITRERTYDGMTKAAAELLAGATISALKTVQRTSSPSGGGIYQVTETVDTIQGDFITLTSA